MLIRKIANLNYALKNQYKPLKILQKERDKQIKFIVNYAYKNNKFYHDLYKLNKVRISKIRGFKDLTKLPIVEKKDLQEHSNILLSNQNGKYLQIQDYKKGIIRRTGGSTGNPLHVYFDEKAWDFSESIYARSLLGTGYDPREILVNSNPFLIPKKRWFNKIGLFRKDFIPVEANNKETLKSLYSYKKPFTFYTYPTVLRNLSSDFNPKKAKINRIISTGELLDEKVKSELESKFECSIHNHYGSMECNRIAWECNKNEGMHLDIDSLGIEFIKNGEHITEGESGQVILTNLHSSSFPLIRYNQGDFAKPIRDKCSCGRNLPIVKELLGRDNDFIKLENKSRISPIPFDVVLSRIGGVSQFKLVQKSIKLFEIFLIPNGKVKISEDKISKEIQNLLRTNNFSINFKYVENIPRSKGGKLRSVVCNI